MKAKTVAQRALTGTTCPTCGQAKPPERMACIHCQTRAESEQQAIAIEILRGLNNEQA